MCRFQKEINSKIQEKKASEKSADGGSPAVGPTRSPEDPDPGPLRSRTTGGMQTLEEAADGPDESARSSEQLFPCGGESVGTAVHDL